MKKRSTGVTLVEVMVSAGLLLGLLWLLTQAYVSAASHQRLLFDSLELEQQCVQAFEGLHTDLLETNIETAVVYPEMLIFASPRFEDGTLSQDPLNATLLWPKVLCYAYFPEDGRLLRKFEDFAPLPDPPDPLEQTPVLDELYFRAEGQLSKTAARDVESFFAVYLKEDGPDPNDRPDPATRADAEMVRIEIGLKTEKEKPLGVRMSMIVVPRN